MSLALRAQVSINSDTANKVDDRKQLLIKLTN